MPRAKPDEEQHQIGIRLGASLVRRADAYALSLSAEHPGMRFTRTDAIRMILTLHLPPDPEAPAEPPSRAPSGNTKPAKPKTAAAKSTKPAKSTAKRKP